MSLEMRPVHVEPVNHHLPRGSQGDTSSDRVRQGIEIGEFHTALTMPEVRAPSRTWSIWNYLGCALRGAVVATLSCAAVVLVPIVSLVAFPILTIMACYHGAKLAFLRCIHSTNGAHGRIPGQDYTQWDGRACPETSRSTTETERAHATVGEYPSGGKDGFRDDALKRNILPKNNPFKSDADLKWLNREYSVCHASSSLKTELRLMRGCAKALIPVLGLAWIFFTEIEFGGACDMTCHGCQGLHDPYSDEYWHWSEAIDFHREILEKKLNLPVKA